MIQWTSNEIALVGADTTVVVALLSALAAYLASKRDRRRTLYSEGVQVIVSWKEMLYRVRRRTDDQTPGLVTAFHELQDKLSFFEAWIGAESKYMCRSYGRLVKQVKGATELLIWQAWDEPIRVAPGKTLPEDIHPDIDEFLDAFSKDLRSHLSPLPWRKLAVAYRNRVGTDEP